MYGCGIGNSIRFVGGISSCIIDRGKQGKMEEDGHSDTNKGGSGC